MRSVALDPKHRQGNSQAIGNEEGAHRVSVDHAPAENRPLTLAVVIFVGVSIRLRIRLEMTTELMQFLPNTNHVLKVTSLLFGKFFSFRDYFQNKQPNFGWGLNSTERSSVPENFITPIHEPDCDRKSSAVDQTIFEASNFSPENILELGANVSTKQQAEVFWPAYLLEYRIHTIDSGLLRYRDVRILEKDLTGPGEDIKNVGGTAREIFYGPTHHIQRRAKEGHQLRILLRRQRDNYATVPSHMAGVPKMGHHDRIVEHKHSVSRRESARCNR